MSDRSSTHGGRWYSSLSSCPWIQAVFFVILFVTQIVLLAIFAQKIFFNYKVDIKTSLEYENDLDFRYPKISICSSVMYNKTILKGKFPSDDLLKSNLCSGNNHRKKRQTNCFIHDIVFLNMGQPRPLFCIFDCKAFANKDSGRESLVGMHHCWLLFT